MSGSDPSNTGDDKGWRPVRTVGQTGDGPVPDGQGDGAGGGGGAGSGNDCLFTEITILSSPNAAVIATLHIGAVLDVAHQQQPSRVVAAAANGQLAGSITSASLADIIECIAMGQTYKAKVLSIQGGQVTVEIYPA